MFAPSPLALALIAIPANLNGPLMAVTLVMQQRDACLHLLLLMDFLSIGLQDVVALFKLMIDSCS